VGFPLRFLQKYQKGGIKMHAQAMTTEPNLSRITILSHPEGSRQGKQLAWRGGARFETIAKTYDERAGWFLRSHAVRKIEDLKPILSGMGEHELLLSGFCPSLRYSLGDKIVSESAILTIDVDGTIRSNTLPHLLSVAKDAQNAFLRDVVGEEILATLRQVLPNTRIPDMICCLSASFLTDLGRLRCKIFIKCDGDAQQIEETRHALAAIKWGGEPFCDPNIRRLGGHNTIHPPKIEPSMGLDHLFQPFFIKGDVPSLAPLRSSAFAPIEEPSEMQKSAVLFAVEVAKEDPKELRKALQAAARSGMKPSDFYHLAENLGGKEDASRLLDFLKRSNGGVPRHLWMGMAQCCRVAGVGFDAFHFWSKRGANYVSREDCRRAWAFAGKRAGGNGGAVLRGIATLQKVKNPPKWGVHPSHIDWIFQQASRQSPLLQKRQPRPWQSLIKNVPSASRYFDGLLTRVDKGSQKGDTIFLKSRHGGGKTHELASLLQEIAPTKTVLAVVMSAALARSLAKRLDIQSYEDYAGLGIEAMPHRIVITYKSLFKLKPWTYDYVIFDEIEEGLPFGFSSIMAKETLNLFLNLAQKVACAERVIICDASLDLSGPSGRFLELCGRIPAAEGPTHYMIDSSYRQKWNADIIRGKAACDGAIKAALEASKSGQFVAFPCTTEKEVRRIRAWAELLGIKIFCVTRPLKEEKPEEMEEFFESPTEFLQKGGFQAIAYNSAMATGVDIQIQDVRVLMGVKGRDGNTINEIMQLAMRCRNRSQTSFLVYSKGKCSAKSPQYFLERSEMERKFWKQCGFRADWDGTRFDTEFARKIADELVGLSSEIQADASRQGESIDIQIEDACLFWGAHLRFASSEGQSVIGEGDLVSDCLNKEDPEVLEAASAKVAEEDSQRLERIATAAHISADQAEELSKRKSALPLHEEESLKRHRIAAILEAEGEITSEDVKAYERGASRSGYILALAMAMDANPSLLEGDCKAAQRLDAALNGFKYERAKSASPHSCAALLQIMMKEGCGGFNSCEKIDAQKAIDALNTERGRDLITICRLPFPKAGKENQWFAMSLHKLSGIKPKSQQKQVDKKRARQLFLPESAIEDALRWTPKHLKDLGREVDGWAGRDFSISRRWPKQEEICLPLLSLEQQLSIENEEMAKIRADPEFQERVRKGIAHLAQMREDGDIMAHFIMLDKPDLDQHAEVFGANWGEEEWALHQSALEMPFWTGIE
jgi:hypothetical protein